MMLMYLELSRPKGDASRFEKVLVPELNMGQLSTLLRDRYLVAAESLNKVTGKPFQISEIENGIRDSLEK